MSVEVLSVIMLSVVAPLRVRFFRQCGSNYPNRSVLKRLSRRVGTPSFGRRTFDRQIFGRHRIEMHFDTKMTKWQDHYGVHQKRCKLCLSAKFILTKISVGQMFFDQKTCKRRIVHFRRHSNIHKNISWLVKNFCIAFLKFFWCVYLLRSFIVGHSLILWLVDH